MLLAYNRYFLTPSIFTYFSSSCQIVAGKRKTSTTNDKTNTHTLNKIKTADKASISNTDAKSTKIGLNEMESNRILIADKDGWC